MSPGVLIHTSKLAEYALIGARKQVKYDNLILAHHNNYDNLAF